MTKQIYLALFFFLASIHLVVAAMPSVDTTELFPVIIGDLFVCHDELAEYAIENPDSLNTYNWILSAGGFLIASDSTAEIEWGNEPGLYLLTVTETAPNGCSGFAQINVEIEDDIVMICNDNLNISLAKSCSLELTYDIILEAPKYEEASYTMIIKDEDGNVIQNPIDHQYINQTLEVGVIHDCSGNQCWGNITIEDKIAPEIACQHDTITCSDFQTYIPSASIVLDNCNDAVLDYEINEILLDCDSIYSRILVVTFNATDASGNEAIPCIAEIHVEKEQLDEIYLPLNHDGLPGNNGTLECSDNYELNDDGYPHPSVTGYPGASDNCSSIEWTYVDIELPLCEADCAVTANSLKIIRNWIIVDWCLGEVMQHAQIIKIEDRTNPVIAETQDISMAVNPFDCSAQIILPKISATDNCSADSSIQISYAASVGTIVGEALFVDAPAKTMGEGIEIIATAYDCCGNFALDTFFIKVFDETAPVVVADAHKIISLLPIGAVTLYASSLDDGSYDNCGPVDIGLKRVDNGIGLPSLDQFPPAGNDNEQYNEVVHFFCDDVSDEPIMVQLRVCDDADMDGYAGGTEDNCNIAMIEVFVQDKYLPVISCPIDLTLNCTEFLEIDIGDLESLNENYGEATGYATCGISISQNVIKSQQIVCGEAVILREFTANSHAGEESCTQTITFLPEDENLLSCNRIKFENLDQSIYDWCDTDATSIPDINIYGCDSINIEELEIDIENLCSTAAVQISVDTFDYANSSACKTYIVHYEAIDQCVFDEHYVDPSTGLIDPFSTDNGYFEYYLVYNVSDTVAPIFFCEEALFTADICEGYTGDISVIAIDECTDSLELFYEWQLDLFDDGSVDYPADISWFTGNSASANTASITAIQPGIHTLLWRVFDGCGNMQTCSQKLEILPEDKNPTPYCFTNLSTAVMPSSQEISLWAVDFDNGSADECGDVILTMIPELELEGLSSTEAYELSYNHQQITIQTNGNYGFLFDCSYLTNGISESIELRIYSTDINGNYDYCTSFITIADNFDVCEDQKGESTISGLISTNIGKSVEMVDVELIADHPIFPMNELTMSEGIYGFSSIFDGLNYVITPSRNDNHVNGVSTIDIVLIQKHILGLEVITDPYKLMAADVNLDCKITGTDMIQIRRLILGKYSNEEFPTNQSWKFVPSDHAFSEFEQPCIYPEHGLVESLSDSVKQDFIAVKIGDINENAKANFTLNPETRTDEVTHLNIENIWLEKGHEYTIEVRSDEKMELFGLQVAFDLSNFTIEEFLPSAMPITNEYLHLKNKELRIAYNAKELISTAENEHLFSLKLVPHLSGFMEDLLRLSSDFVAEGYHTESLDIKSVALSFINSKSASTSVGNPFLLFQNIPNPFSSKTTIPFFMDKEGDVEITVMDSYGHIHFRKSDHYSPGHHALSLDRSSLVGKGIYFYTLKTGSGSVTRKMLAL